MSEVIMMFLGEQKLIDADFKNSIELVKGYSNKVFEDNTKDCRNVFENAKKNRDEKARQCESNEKEYKALKRYREALEKVEKLLGIIPEPKSEFKLEDLSKKMEKLQEARKKTTNQATFSYFQNILTNTITNLLSVEKDYQSGALSESVARQRMTVIYNDIKENQNQIPNELRNIFDESFEQSLHMVLRYQEAFSKVGEKKEKESTELIDTDFSDKQKINMDYLNIETKGLMAKISDLNADMCDFVPQVDLSDLTKQIQSADEQVTGMVFDPDRLDEKVTDIEHTASKLTIEQNEKNEKSSELCSKIEDISTKTEQLTKDSLRDSAIEFVKDMVKRKEVSIENAEDIKELIEEGVIDENIADEISNTMIEQSEADLKVGTKVAASNPEVVQLNEVEETAEISAESAEDLKNYIAEAVLMRTPKRDRPEDEEEGKR